MEDPRIHIPQQFNVLPHEALVNVWWTGMLMKRLARRFFREMGISEAEFNLLLVLRDAPRDLSQSDLSQSLLVDKSNVTALIDKLVEAGMIRRRRDPSDRRRYHVELRAAGRQRVDEIAPAYRRLVGEIMRGFGERECKQLIQLTRKLRTGLVAVQDGGAGGRNDS